MTCDLKKSKEKLEEKKDTRKGKNSSKKFHP